MGNKNMGALNKKEMDKKKNIIIMVVVIVLLIAIAIVFTTRKKSETEAKQKVDFPKVIEKAETRVVFIGSSDKEKCKNCDKIKDYLDRKKINYLVYDVEDYSKKEYTSMLKSIEINPPDFGYPAVVYMKDGKLYANVINLSDTSHLEEFIKTYNLENVK